MILKSVNRLILVFLFLLTVSNFALAKSVPSVDVRLSKPVYYITINPQTGAPEMPGNVSAAAVCPNSNHPIIYTWHASLDWNFPAFPTHHSIGNRSYLQSSPLRLDFGNEIRGGTLTITASALIDGHRVQGTARAQVLAANPAYRQVINAFPLNRFGIIASKIGVWESGMKQFNLMTAKHSAGLPYTSLTKDVGMMQLNAACGSLSTPEQVWDWRANLRRGLEILASKFEASRNYPVEIASQRITENRISRSSLPSRHVSSRFRQFNTKVNEGLSAKFGSGQQKGDLDVDHLFLSAWERDAIRRYNGGREYSCKVQRDSFTGQIKIGDWEADATRGGIKPSCGDREYVRHVLGSRSGLILLLPKPPRMSSL